jgi:hypothetical protein
MQPFYKQFFSQNPFQNSRYPYNYFMGDRMEFEEHSDVLEKSKSGVLE